MFAVCANTEFRYIKRPDPLVLREGQTPSRKYCWYHRTNGHDTNKKRARSPRNGKAVVNEVTKPSKEEDSDSEEEPDTRKSKGRPMALVILGGYPI